MTTMMTNKMHRLAFWYDPYCFNDWVSGVCSAELRLRNPFRSNWNH